MGQLLVMPYQLGEEFPSVGIVEVGSAVPGCGDALVPARQPVSGDHYACVSCQLPYWCPEGGWSACTIAAPTVILILPVTPVNFILGGMDTLGWEKFLSFYPS